MLIVALRRFASICRSLVIVADFSQVHVHFLSSLTRRARPTVPRHLRRGTRRCPAPDALPVAIPLGATDAFLLPRGGFGRALGLVLLSRFRPVSPRRPRRYPAQPLTKFCCRHRAASLFTCRHQPVRPQLPFGPWSCCAFGARATTEFLKIVRAKNDPTSTWRPTARGCKPRTGLRALRTVD